MAMNGIIAQLKGMTMGVAILTSVASSNTFAYSVYQDASPPLAFGIIWQPYYCIEGPPGYSCPGGEWTQRPLPNLSVDDHVSLTTASSNFGFSLGNTLIGNTTLSLSPFFRGDTSPSRDELAMIVVNRTDVIATSDFGSASFYAIPGVDYYVLLEGSMRVGQSYDMSVSQVPLPAAWLLLLSGLMVFNKFSSMRRGMFYNSQCNRYLQQ